MCVEGLMEGASQEGVLQKDMSPEGVENKRCVWQKGSWPASQLGKSAIHKMAVLPICWWPLECQPNTQIFSKWPSGLNGHLGGVKWPFGPSPNAPLDHS